MAPSTNTAVTSMTEIRRPYRSENQETPTAPMTAPTRMAEVTISSCTEVKWKSLVIRRSAPEIIPVSYP